jgi:hypothetical protein
MQVSVMEAALGYVRDDGFAVFPVHSMRAGGCTCGSGDCKDIAKHPAVARGVHAASKDVDQVGVVGQNALGKRGHRNGRDQRHLRHLHAADRYSCVIDRAEQPHSCAR